jgi:phenylalanyl-tRNA synthetase alpha chain
MNLDEILKEAEREFAAAGSLPVLDQVKARFIGKSGAITEQMKGLGALPPDERKMAGARINQVKDQVEALLRADARPSRPPNWKNSWPPNPWT